MPASKTLALEKRIEKLERENAAYKRQLSRGEQGANAGARDLNQRLITLRKAVHDFFDAAEARDVRWNVHPDVSAAYTVLQQHALAELKTELVESLRPEPQPTKRRPTV